MVYTNILHRTKLFGGGGGGGIREGELFRRGFIFSMSSVLFLHDEIWSSCCKIKPFRLKNETYSIHNDFSRARELTVEGVFLFRFWCGEGWINWEGSYWRDVNRGNRVYGQSSRLKTTLWSSHAFSEYIYWPNSEREKKRRRREIWRERERRERRFGVNTIISHETDDGVDAETSLSFFLSLFISLLRLFFSRSLLGQ